MFLDQLDTGFMAGYLDEDGLTAHSATLPGFGNAGVVDIVLDDGLEELDGEVLELHVM